MIKNRRQFLKYSAAGAVLASLPLANAVWSKSVSKAELQTLKSDWKQWLPADNGLDLGLQPIELGRDEWKSRLTPAAFDVLRKEGTERPFTSPLNDVKDRGIYLCAGCDLPLFTSDMKFDSGTGWPSFFTAIPGHLETKRDFKMIWPRTEYHCIRCGGHQGHVFDDGPQPTGQRWCNNGVALKFLADSSD